MKTLITLALLLLMSCSDMIDESHFDIDPKLKSFVEQFYKEGYDRGMNLPKQNLIIALKSNLANTNHAWGLTVYEGTITKVYIDQEIFDFYTVKINHPEGIEAIIFHEMGHAALLLKHNKCLNSLMNPSILGSGDCYRIFSRKEFIDQLFGITECH